MKKKTAFLFSYAITKLDLTFIPPGWSFHQYNALEYLGYVQTLDIPGGFQRILHKSPSYSY